MEYHYDTELAERPIRWIEEYCSYPDGAKAGQPIELLPYFKDIIRNAYGWVDDAGNLKHQVIYTEVPRGNAKTVNGATIALYSVFGYDETMRRVYMCAGSRDQATEMFEPAMQMVRNEPDLSGISDIRPSYKQIIDKDTFSYIKALAAEGFRQHGKKTNVCLFDELHVQPNSNLWDAMRTSLTKKQNSMMWVFTTAGMTGTFAEEVHNYAMKVKDEVIDDPHWLVNIYGADPEADIFDEKTWEEANPAWEIINKDAFRGVARTAENNLKEQNAFRRYHLNIWTGSEAAFLSIADWDRCAIRDLQIANFKGKKCYTGLDYGSSRDLTAYARLFPPQDGIEHPTIFVDFFCPEDTIYEREKTENVNYEVWVQQGLVTPTEGNFVDKDYLFRHITEDLEGYDWQCIGIDPAQTDTLRAKLLHFYDDLEEQEKVRRTRQGEWLNSAIDELENWVVNNTLRHDGNPVMRWMCDNMAIKESQTTNRKRIIKRSGSEHNKIDGFAAVLNCIYEYLEDERKNATELSDLFTKAI